MKKKTNNIMIAALSAGIISVLSPVSIAEDGHESGKKEHKEGGEHKGKHDDGKEGKHKEGKDSGKGEHKA